MKKKIIWIQDIFLTKEPSTESITESSQSLAVFYSHSSFFFLPNLKGEHFAGLEPVKCLSVALNGPCHEITTVLPWSAPNRKIDRIH